MSELEHRVRDALAAHELPAPDGARLLDQVRARSTRRRQHGWSAAALAAATTAAVITVVTVRAQKAPEAPQPADAVTTAAPATPTPSATPTLPPDTQLVSFHGVELAVPAAWTINATRCGTPMADTVQVWDGGAIPACLTKQPPGLTVVQVWAYEPGDQADEPMAITPRMAALATQVTTVDGEPALRGVGVPDNFDGKERAVLVLPDPGVLISVESPDSQRAQDLLDGVRLAPVDHNGCREKVDMLTTPVSERAGVADALVPDTPVGASICRYSGDWLGASAAVDTRDLDTLVTTLNALPVGTSTPGPEFFEVEEACADDVHRGFLVQLSYAEGPPVDVYVRISGCPVLSASNGARTTRVDQPLTDFLINRVYYDGGFPDPRTLR